MVTYLHFIQTTIQIKGDVGALAVMAKMSTIPSAEMVQL